MNLIDPIIIKIKLLIQELWRRGLNWDTKIPDDLLRDWNTWKENVIKMLSLKLPRWIIFSPNCEVAELHIFGDASNKACVTTAHIKLHLHSLNFMSLKTQSINIFIIFPDFLIVEQIFHSPQVERIVILSNKLVRIRVASQVVEQLKS